MNMKKTLLISTICVLGFFWIPICGSACNNLSFRQQNLITAAINGDIERAYMAIRDDDSIINTTYERDYTPLMLAVDNNHLEVVKYLVMNGAIVDARDRRDGMTALMIAVKHNYMNIAMFLIDKGANVSVRDNNGVTALNIAQQNKHAEMIDLLTSNGAQI